MLHVIHGIPFASVHRTWLHNLTTQESHLVTGRDHMSDPTSVLPIRRRHGRQAQPTPARSDCEREVKPAFPRAKFLATRLSQAGCDTLVQAAAAFSRQRSGIPLLVSQRGHKLREERPVSAPQMATPSLPAPEFHYDHRQHPGDPSCARQNPV